MEDTELSDNEALNGMSKVYEKLINDGRAGGKKIIQGSQKTLLNSINRSIPYRLIILDNIFSSKGTAAKTRLMREWSNFINDNIDTPVLSLEEIRSKYRFDRKDAIKMVSFAIVTIVVVWLIFQFDEQILSFLIREGIGWKLLAMAFVFLFVPFFAYSYSTVTKLFFKLIKFE